MSYRNLSPQAMVNITGPWLDPAQDRPLLTALPLLAPLLAVLEDAHEGIKATQRVGSSVQQQIKELTERGGQLDGRHDRKMRGCHGFLGAAAEITDDPERAEALLDLRDRLLPDGLRATMRSYTEQAGDAKLLPSRLDAASSALLDSLQTPDGPLRAVVNDWMATAMELGQVDDQRTALAKLLPADAGGVTPRDAQNAKNAWIRAVRAVETILALEKNVTAEMTERLLGRLNREAARAARRAAGREEVEEVEGVEGVDEEVDEEVEAAEAPHQK